ncbi:vWA domain-containing protein [Pseudalkalibacillus hwajinpoensis]|uniref:vWA domain-containing protein n=1 Tax=Guptibacillus hwajinpoensis TaxID=208199 RepID=UPI001CFDBF23|nr:VWA domain-containing protein [Pseudalkalibacillus hwajinpoensis]
MKYRTFMICILIFILTACSSNNEATQEEPSAPKKESRESNNKQPIINEEIHLSVSLDSLKNMTGGTLTNDLNYEDDAAKLKTNHELPSALATKLPDALEKLSKEAKDMKAYQQGLLTLLSSPNYPAAIDKAENYEPPFEEPYLPDPTVQKEEENQEAPNKAIVLLDASSSMLLESNGEQKMTTAKKAVKSFAQTIGKSSDISLVVYGHKGSEADEDKQRSCSGIEEVYPMGSYDKAEFQEAVNAFDSKGWTPLAAAIEKADKMSQSYDSATTIYIVSDGAETCDGDPVAASEKLSANGNTVNIIGFDVDAEAENQLKEVAAAGNGEYFQADSPDDLKQTIEYEWLPSIGDLAWAHTMAPNGWEISDEYKKAEQAPKEMRSISRREAFRIDESIRIMEEKEWITEQQATELKDWNNERRNAFFELDQKLGEVNRDKVNAQAEQIRKDIQAWVEKMEKLKEESGN